jgi:hypothetical protein
MNLLVDRGGFRITWMNLSRSPRVGFFSRCAYVDDALEELYDIYSDRMAADSPIRVERYNTDGDLTDIWYQHDRSQPGTMTKRAS